MRIMLVILVSLLVNMANAQQLESFVENGVAYINHMVVKGESSFAIANVYGVETDALLKANNLQQASVLQEGIKIKVPVSGIIKPACSADSCLPVYYTVQQSEGLYRIGKNHGDVKVEQVKKLNHLSSQSVSKGQHLLIGFIAIAAKVINVAGVAGNDDNLTVEKPVAVDDSNVADTIASSPIATPAVPAKRVATKKLIGDSLMLNYKGAGVFEQLFVAGNTLQQLNAAAFKSESGWADGKFYALADGLENGKIVRIKNPANGVVVYARVLGPLPHVKHAEEVQLRISSAAMLTLGFIFDDFYPVVISY